MDNPCARCAKQLGRSCCEVGKDDWLATLTRADVERIEQNTGTSRHHFVQMENFDWNEMANYVDMRPLYAGYFDRSAQRWTLQREAGACVFFEREQGCTLDAATRPSACLLYPFDFAEGDRMTLQVDRFPSLEEAQESLRMPGEAACLAVQESSDWEELAASFNTSEEALRALARRIREEVKAHRMLSRP